MLVSDKKAGYFGSLTPSLHLLDGNFPPLDENFPLPAYNYMLEWGCMYDIYWKLAVKEGSLSVFMGACKKNIEACQVLEARFVSTTPSEMKRTPSFHTKDHTLVRLTQTLGLKSGTLGSKEGTLR